MGSELIRELESQRGYPAISVFLPTHRTHPENKQDAIHLKNLVREVEERLHQEFTKREAQSAVQNLAQLVESVDHEHNLDGLALFASADYRRAMRLPFPVKARVQIDESFAVRDLVYAFNRSPHYLVLVLDENNTRLYGAYLDFLEEVKLGKFPLSHGGPGGASRLPGGHGVNPSAVRDAHRREFVRKVDQELEAVLKIDDSPVVVTGTEDFLADFTSMTQHSERVIGTLKGSHGETSPHVLGELVWPVAKAGFAALRANTLSRLDAAVSAGKYASGIVQVWEAASQGRVDLLVVEADFRQPGILPADAGHLPTLVDDPTDPSAEDDLVDLAIQLTLEKGGKVSFADPGTLAQHDRIAAILRF